MFMFLFTFKKCLLVRHPIFIKVSKQELLQCPCASTMVSTVYNHKGKRVFSEGLLVISGARRGSAMLPLDRTLAN